jgi:hypothetical protein
MDIVRKREACKVRLTRKRAVRGFLLEYEMQAAKVRAVLMSVAKKPTQEGEKLDMIDSFYLRTASREPTLSQQLHTARHHSGGGSSFALHE